MPVPGVSPRGEGPGIPFETEHLNFAYRNAPFCCLHSVIQSRLLPILQGIVRAQSKRHGKQMCEMLLRSVGHCFGGDGAGEARVRHYLLFWPQGSEVGMDKSMLFR